MSRVETFAHYDYAKASKTVADWFYKSSTIKKDSTESLENVPSKRDFTPRSHLFAPEKRHC